MATGSVQSCAHRCPPFRTLHAFSGRSRLVCVGRCPFLSASWACCLTHSYPARLPTDPISSSSAGFPLGSSVSTWNVDEARVDESPCS
eukprot:15461430-Alexandrium_andersonii.AAC.1